MKPMLLILGCTAFFSASAQRVDFLTRFNMHTAIAEQTNKLQNAYGIGFGAEAYIPDAIPLRLFATADFSVNGVIKEPYEFEFQNVITRTNIRHTNYIMHFGGGLRYLFNKDKKISPYAGAGAGILLYHTQYELEDPGNPGACNALESHSTHSDRAFTNRIEGGLRLATKWETSPGQRIYFDAGITYLCGHNASFMRLSRHESSEGIPYKIKFQTPFNEVHEHRIGTIHRTPISQLLFHIGGVIPLGAPRSGGLRMRRGLPFSFGGF